MGAIDLLGRTPDLILKGNELIEYIETMMQPGDQIIIRGQKTDSPDCETWVYHGAII